MDHHHENTHLIGTQEQDMENNEVEQDEFHDEKNNCQAPEEELGHIHPDLDFKKSYPTMNSGVIKIHQNDLENIIDDPEDSRQY